MNVQVEEEEIDEVSTRDDESSDDESSDESSEESSEEPSVPKTLEEVKADAINSIKGYAELFWYSDESWTKVEKIVADYNERINSANDEDNVNSLEKSAKSEIDSIPKLNAH